MTYENDIAKLKSAHNLILGSSPSVGSRAMFRSHVSQIIHRLEANISRDQFPGWENASYILTEISIEFEKQIKDPTRYTSVLGRISAFKGALEAGEVWEGN